MSDPGSPAPFAASYARPLAAAVIAGVMAWLLVIASVQAQLPTPGASMQPPRPPDNPGPSVAAIHVNVGGREIDRAEVDQDIVLTANVAESKTAVSHLIFNWTVPVGEIRGEGSTVAWRIPKGTPTPVSSFPTLELVEQYPDFESGLVPLMKEHRTSADGPMMHVNDSIAEVTTISRAFLVDYFGNSSVSPEACLVDFSDTCRGKAEELDDIRINRSKYLIKTVAVGAVKIEFHPSMNAAYVTAPCEIHDIERSTGRPHMMRADCLLTAVYDKPRWYLCDSHTANGIDGYEDELGALAAPIKP
jgi:hypothetical protein